MDTSKLMSLCTDKRDRSVSSGGRSGSVGWNTANIAYRVFEGRGDNGFNTATIEICATYAARRSVAVCPIDLLVDNPESARLLYRLLPRQRSSRRWICNRWRLSDHAGLRYLIRFIDE